MGIYDIKPKFQKTLRPVEALLITYKVHPTYINVFGLVLSILGGITLPFTQMYPLLLLYIPVMAFVRTACNALDGMVARSLKVNNQEFGEVLNEFLDRISDSAIFFGLALANYTNIYLGSVVVIIILLNSYLSIASKAAGGSRQYKGFMGKADRMIYIGIFAVALFITREWMLANWFLWFIGLGTLLTMFQRFMMIRTELYHE